MTTDPAGQYNSPYLGMGNNPIIAIDPDGGKIEVEGSFFFRLGVRVKLFFAKTFSSGARDLINSLEESDNVHTIISAKGGNYTQSDNFGRDDSPKGYITTAQLKSGGTIDLIGTGKGTGSTVGFNFNKKTGGTDINGSNERPPVIGLLHELVHASDIDKGTIQRGLNINGVKISEQKASDHENVFRAQLGIPLRKYYGGKNILHENHIYHFGAPRLLPRAGYGVLKN